MFTFTIYGSLIVLNTARYSRWVRCSVQCLSSRWYLCYFCCCYCYWCFCVQTTAHHPKIIIVWNLSYCSLYDKRLLNYTWFTFLINFSKLIHTHWFSFKSLYLYLSHCSNLSAFKYMAFTDIVHDLPPLFLWARIIHARAIIVNVKGKSNWEHWSFIRSVDKTIVIERSV